MSPSAFLLVLVLSIMPGLAAGQTIRVNSGEHPGFTRVVLSVPPGTSWTLTETEGGHAFLPSIAGNFDLSRLFDRIPRQRLTSTRIDGDRLVFLLACDCPIRAWEERAGLVVIDILDETVAAIEDAGDPPDAPDFDLQPTPVEGLLAQQVGQALARERRANTAAPEVPASLDDSALAQLPADLGERFAHALSQGLLEASAGPGTQTVETGVVLRPVEILNELPENVRVVDVTSRTSSEPPSVSLPDPTCQEAHVLDVFLNPPDVGFAQGLTGLGHELYGEFDQPSDEAFLRLVQHYLAAGLGAEARALMQNYRSPLPGRDLLVGLSDLLEGRMSNSRMRLAASIDCGGVAALAASLAQPESQITGEVAASITLTYVGLPAPLRAVFGADLVAELLEAGAGDSARVVMESLRTSGWASEAEIALAQARLEESRGQVDRASMHLDPVVTRDLAGTLAWLEIAARQGTAVAESTLDDAVSLAAQHRGSDDAGRLMSAVVRLRAVSQQPENALTDLDRLASWQESRSSADGSFAALRDEVWSALALRAEDRPLISASLARTDWLDSALGIATRQALANRFIDLGFANAADQMIAGERDPVSLRLRARAALLRGEPQPVFDLLDGDSSPEALQIRSSASSQMGAHDQALDLRETARDLDAAARSAVLQGSWRRLEDLRERGASIPGLDPAAGRYLGHSPGEADVLETLARPTDESQAQGVGDSHQDSTVQPSGPATATPDEAAGSVAVESSSSNAEAIIDDLGMVSRAALLLAESARLRDAIGVVLETSSGP